MRMNKRSVWVVVAVVLCSLGSTSAQQPIPRPRAAAPARPQPPSAPSATLVIEGDAACRIVVDGGDPIDLAANGVRTLRLEPGEHLVRAASIEYPEAIWRRTIEVTAGQRRAVLIELRAVIEPFRVEAEHRRARPRWRRQTRSASANWSGRGLRGAAKCPTSRRRR